MDRPTFDKLAKNARMHARSETSFRSQAPIIFTSGQDTDVRFLTSALTRDPSKLFKGDLKRVENFVAYTKQQQVLAQMVEPARVSVTTGINAVGPIDTDKLKAPLKGPYC